MKAYRLYARIYQLDLANDRVDFVHYAARHVISLEHVLSRRIPDFAESRVKRFI
jgi:hypothetical protein